MIRDFTYIGPSTVKEALDSLSQHKDECKIICGGQSLLILMRQGLIAPTYLIDVKRLKELKYIDFDPKNGLKIGAATTHREVEKSAVIKEKYRVLADMETKLASIQTRNWGTIGGNLCHGEPAGDLAPVLIALKATLKTAKLGKERNMAVEDFFKDYFETALDKDELLLEIQVPLLLPRSATTYEKFVLVENDIGIVSVAASVTLDGSTICKEARIVLGGAAPIPKRAKKAEEILVGKEINDRLLDQTGQMASAEAEPISDIHASEDYRRELVKVLTKRMVKKAWEQAEISA